MVILPFMEGGSAMEFLKKLGTTEIGLAIGCIVGEVFFPVVQCTLMALLFS